MDIPDIFCYNIGVYLFEFDDKCNNLHFDIRMGKIWTLILKEG